MSDRRNIAILVPLEVSLGREIFEGVLSYSRSLGRGQWRFLWSGKDLNKLMPIVSKDNCNGIIVVSHAYRKLREVCQKTLPCVTVGGLEHVAGTPNVRIDDIAVGRMGAKYFLDRGYKRFIYAGTSSYPSIARRDGFCREVQKTDKDLSLLCEDIPTVAASPPRRRTNRMHEWINSSPDPVGLMAFDDAVGHTLKKKLEESNIPVPGKVAVLGVNNDRLFCEVTVPHLSSINNGLQRIGYNAASILDQIMAGSAPPAEPVLLQPLGVVTRQSTDVLAVDDDIVIQATRYISEHACDPIQVSDVVRKVCISRRSLEKRFDKALGRSPYDEINRIQVERASKLLVETNMPVGGIAHASGFNCPNQLYVAFKKTFGVPPGEYRRKNTIPC